MKKMTFVEAEEISFDEISENLVAVNLKDEKFLIDMDTLYDLAFRCASFLAYLENREEPQESTAPMIH